MCDKKLTTDEQSAGAETNPQQSDKFLEICRWREDSRHRTSPGGGPRITVLIPAHNEEATLAASIDSALNQTVPVTEIVVVSDNSTDRTQEIACSYGGRVRLIETVNNKNRKSGALNQALAQIVPTLDDDDWVVEMDADSELGPVFVERALEVASGDSKIGAIGGIFLPATRRSVLERLQGLEYVRNAREIDRGRGKAKVLTGTSTMLRAKTLRVVQQARTEGRLPGSGYYHEHALTEDFCLTLAIKKLGYTCVSPRQCTVTTEVMPTVGMLWRQRVRWQRGAIQAIGFYGLTRVTMPYVVKQLEVYFGFFMVMLLATLTGWSLWAGNAELRPFWMLIGLVFWAERIVSAWGSDLIGRLIAILWIPDFVYDVFIGLVFLWAFFVALRRKPTTWGLKTSTAISPHHLSKCAGARIDELRHRSCAGDLDGP
jgi:poly-beta-1,6-N-acetyl-D-glucosamine synthase